MNSAKPEDFPVHDNLALDFLDYLKAERSASENTIRNYRQALGRFILWTRRSEEKPRDPDSTGISWNKITKFTIREYLQSFMESSSSDARSQRLAELKIFSTQTPQRPASSFSIEILL